MPANPTPSRTPPLTLDVALSSAGVAPASPPGVGLKSAAGTDLVDGFYVDAMTTDPARLLAFVVAAGRFVRYEWTAVPAAAGSAAMTEATLTSVVGCHRIGGVDLATDGPRVVLTVTIDAAVVASAGKSVTSTIDGQRVTETVWRSEPVTYRLETDDPARADQLRAFGAALGRSLGHWPRQPAWP